MSKNVDLPAPEAPIMAGYDKKSTASDDACNERRVDLLDGSGITWHFGLVQTLATSALQRDVLVAEDHGNQIVHSRLLKPASIF